MKWLPLILVLASSSVWADCKVKSASYQRDGVMSKESVTVCQNGQIPNTKIKIGDTILETEVGPTDVKVGYFKYNNAQCRLFTDRESKNGKLRVYHGVICQVDNSSNNWIVVDKW